MIPLAAIPWRLVGAVGLVAAVGIMGWRVSAWHEAYKALPGVRDALAAEEACQDGSKCSERQKALQELAEHERKVAVDGLQAELDEIRSRPPVRRVIRVCPDPGDLHGPGSATGTDGTGPATAVISGPAEFDTQPLFDLAREADEVAARLRALQGWNQALSATVPPAK